MSAAGRFGAARGIGDHRRPARMPASARVLMAMLSRLTWGRLTVLGPGGFRQDFGGVTGAGEAARANANESEAARANTNASAAARTNTTGRADSNAHAGNAGTPVHAQIELGDWAICAEILSGGDIAFAEGYMQERWHTPDLVALLTVAAHNQHALEQSFYGTRLRQLAMRVLHALRSNTRSGARRNIAAHYDLGNDFYALWLDATMSYSSALFEGADQSLPDAQSNKYKRILRELDLQSGQHVLEVGAGWGGFAEEALASHAIRLTGLSLSPAQTAYANERLQKRGLADRGEIVLRDYRDECATYDAVASIEMFEAVGERYWPLYFQCLHRVLRPAGRAVIQAITIDEDRFERYRSGSDFIQQYIFPGGMLAPKQRMVDEAAAAGFRVEARHDFGRDYERTLLHWLHRFDREETAVRALGFDTRFVRMWRFYLAYCAAGFNAGTTDVSQFTFVRD